MSRNTSRDLARSTEDLWFRSVYCTEPQAWGQRWVPDPVVSRRAPARPPQPPRGSTGPQAQGQRWVPDPVVSRRAPARPPQPPRGSTEPQAQGQRWVPDPVVSRRAPARPPQPPRGSTEPRPGAMGGWSERQRASRNHLIEWFRDGRQRALLNHRGEAQDRGRGGRRSVPFGWLRSERQRASRNHLIEWFRDGRQRALLNHRGGSTEAHAQGQAIGAVRVVEERASASVSKPPDRVVSRRAPARPPQPPRSSAEPHAQGPAIGAEGKHRAAGRRDPACGSAMG